MSGKPLNSKRRYELGRGIGEGPAYEPFIKPREARSAGNATLFPDPVSGRMISLLSDGELRWFLHIRFNDETADIQEQKLLDQETIERICREYGKRPGKYLSTDLFVRREDGTQEAYFIKPDESCLKTDRVKERIAIEKLYCEEKKIKFFLRFKTDIPQQEHINLLSIFPAWSEKMVYDDFSLARHLIVRKIIKINITQPIDYVAFLQEHEEEMKTWKQLYKVN